MSTGEDRTSDFGGPKDVLLAGIAIATPWVGEALEVSGPAKYVMLGASALSGLVVIRRAWNAEDRQLDQDQLYD